MKMTRAYFEETVDAFVQHGYECTWTEERVAPDGADDPFAFDRLLARLERPAECFLYEYVRHASGVEHWFLEVRAYHRLRTYSLRLDSWKHRPDRIEFKFLADADTGMGPSFILAWPDSP